MMQFFNRFRKQTPVPPHQNIKPVAKQGKLSPGTRVALMSKRVAIVLEWIDEGTQGNVYKAAMNEVIVCLKIFKESGATTIEQRKNLVKYAAMGRPTRNFVKVLDIVPSVRGNVPAGYVMEWVDTEKLEGINCLLKYDPLPPLRNLIDLALILMISMKRLHGAKGMAYLDFSPANLLWDFLTGRVLRYLDPDNITPNSVPVGVYGTPGCLAPEVVKENVPSSFLTDLYGCSILLFQLLCGGMHPLYGRRHLRFRTDTVQVKLYMEVHNPVFVYDPNNKVNRPHEHHHGRLIYCWYGLPVFMKALFIRAFGEALHHPNRRITEIDWIDALLKLRGLIERCPKCKEERFVEPANSPVGAKSTICRKCQSQYQVGPRLTLEAGKEVVLSPGSTLLSSQLSTQGTIHKGRDRTIAAVCKVGRIKKSLALKNLSCSSWNIIRGEKAHEVRPGTSIKITPKLKIQFPETPAVGVINP